MLCCRGMCKTLLRSDGQQRSYGKAKFQTNLNCGLKNVSETAPGLDFSDLYSVSKTCSHTQSVTICAPVFNQHRIILHINIGPEWHLFYSYFCIAMAVLHTIFSFAKHTIFVLFIILSPWGMRQLFIHYCPILKWRTCICVGYPPGKHLTPKSREIPCPNKWLLNCQFALEFCTKHDSIIIVLSA